MIFILLTVRIYTIPIFFNNDSIYNIIAKDDSFFFKCLKLNIQFPTFPHLYIHTFSLIYLF